MITTYKKIFFFLLMSISYSTPLLTADISPIQVAEEMGIFSNIEFQSAIRQLCKDHNDQSTLEAAFVIPPTQSGHAAIKIARNILKEHNVHNIVYHMRPDLQYPICLILEKSPDKPITLLGYYTTGNENSTVIEILFDIMVRHYQIDLFDNKQLAKSNLSEWLYIKKQEFTEHADNIQVVLALAENTRAETAKLLQNIIRQAGFEAFKISRHPELNSPLCIMIARDSHANLLFFSWSGFYNNVNAIKTVVRKVCYKNDADYHTNGRTISKSLFSLESPLSIENRAMLRNLLSNIDHRHQIEGLRTKLQLPTADHASSHINNNIQEITNIAQAIGIEIERDAALSYRQNNPGLHSQIPIILYGINKKEKIASTIRYSIDENNHFIEYI